MKKILSTLLVPVMSIMALASFGAVSYAAEADENVYLHEEASALGESLTSINTENFAGQLGTFINYVLTILGLVTLLYLLYGGVIMLTSQGNEDKIAEARKIITYAIVGVIIIALAYAINAWIFGSAFFIQNPAN